MSYTRYEHFIDIANEVIATLVSLESTGHRTRFLAPWLVESGKLQLLVRTFQNLANDTDRCDALGFMAMRAEQFEQNNMPKAAIVLRRLYEVFLKERNAIQERMVSRPSQEIAWSQSGQEKEQSQFTSPAMTLGA